MARVTNITRGPRFVYAKGSPVLLNAGETRDFDLRDHEVKNVQQQVDAKVLAWDGEAPQAKADASTGEGGGSESSDDVAAALAIKDGNFMTFKSAAAKILGASLPGTKAEIVAALEAKAKADAAAQGGQA